jgi:hypothetical protein
MARSFNGHEQKQKIISGRMRARRRGTRSQPLTGPFSSNASYLDEKVMLHWTLKVLKLLWHSAFYFHTDKL